MVFESEWPHLGGQFSDFFGVKDYFRFLDIKGLRIILDFWILKGYFLVCF